MDARMTFEETQKKLLNVISEITGVPADQVDPLASLATNGVNSMGFVELLLYVERTWGLRLMEEGLGREDVASVSAFARKLHQLIGT
jgi:acyl carrier protein